MSTPVRKNRPVNSVEEASSFFSDTEAPSGTRAPSATAAMPRPEALPEGCSAPTAAAKSSIARSTSTVVAPLKTILVWPGFAPARIVTGLSSLIKAPKPRPRNSSSVPVITETPAASPISSATSTAGSMKAPRSATACTARSVRSIAATSAPRASTARICFAPSRSAMIAGRSTASTTVSCTSGNTSPVEGPCTAVQSS